MQRIHTFRYTNYDACKKRHDEYHPRGGEHSRCPYYLKDDGKCFGFCDLDSQDICGECINFIPQRDEDGNAVFYLTGHCFHHIGQISIAMRTSCPFYVKRKDCDVFADELIEHRVKELCDFDKYSAEAREFRKIARKEWLENHPIQQDRIR